MSYKITITETREVTKKVGKEWVKLGHKEVKKNSQYWNDSDSLQTDPVFLSDDMGYSPEIEKTVTEDRQVLCQTVDELDIAAVIKAINKL